MGRRVAPQRLIRNHRRPLRHAGALAFALRFDDRKRKRDAAEFMAAIVAKRLVDHLDRAGFVVMRRPTIGGATVLNREVALAAHNLLARVVTPCFGLGALRLPSATTSCQPSSRRRRFRAVLQASGVFRERASNPGSAATAASHRNGVCLAHRSGQITEASHSRSRRLRPGSRRQNAHSHKPIVPVRAASRLTWSQQCAISVAAVLGCPFCKQTLAHAHAQPVRRCNDLPQLTVKPLDALTCNPVSRRIPTTPLPWRDARALACRAVNFRGD